MMTILNNRDAKPSFNIAKLSHAQFDHLEHGTEWYTVEHLWRRLLMFPINAVCYWYENVVLRPAPMSF